MTHLTPRAVHPAGCDKRPKRALQRGQQGDLRDGSLALSTKPRTPRCSSRSATSACCRSAGPGWQRQKPGRRSQGHGQPAGWRAAAGVSASGRDDGASCKEANYVEKGRGRGGGWWEGRRRRCKGPAMLADSLACPAAHGKGQRNRAGVPSGILAGEASAAGNDRCPTATTQSSLLAKRSRPETTLRSCPPARAMCSLLPSVSSEKSRRWLPPRRDPKSGSSSRQPRPSSAQVLTRDPRMASIASFGGASGRPAFGRPRRGRLWSLP